MIPTAGRIVHYKLNEDDVKSIQENRGCDTDKNCCRGNGVRAWDVFPAMIVKTWGGGEGSAVQLQVFLDGNDTHWATSRTEGDQAGQWSVPPRV